MGGIQFENAYLAYGQSETNNSDSSNLILNSTSSANSNAAEIVLLSQKLKKATSDDIIRHVIGQVINIGNEPATLVRADLTIYDKNGDIIGTAWSYVQGDILNPNQKSTFDMGTNKEDFKGMGYYEIALQWRNHDGTKGYVDNAQLYKNDSTKGSEYGQELSPSLTENEKEYCESEYGDNITRCLEILDKMTPEERQYCDGSYNEEEYANVICPPFLSKSLELDRQKEATKEPPSDIISNMKNMSAESNIKITGTYDGKGIYKVEDMSVKITSNTNEYRFLGSITNLSNETMYLTGIAIQMYDKNNKLIDYTSINQEGTIEPRGKIVYKVFAPIVDNENFDHYVISAVGSNNPSDNTTTPSDKFSLNEQELYDECVSTAGESFCDFLFKK